MKGGWQRGPYLAKEECERLVSNRRGKKSKRKQLGVNRRSGILARRQTPAESAPG